MPYKDPEKQKAYNKEYSQKHHKHNYEKHKETFKINSDYTRKKNALAYFEEKEKYVCCKCGEDHIACLEFHHTDPSCKEGSVSNLIRGSLKKALLEIQKCIVVCSNCHKKIHWDDDKIENLKKDIIDLEKKKEEINKRKEILRQKRNVCRGCKKNKDEVEFVKGRCFCKECYKIHQKEKMKKRRQ